MRRAAAFLLALAAAAALPAAKPVPPGDGPAREQPEDEGRELWRGTAVSICVGHLRPVPQLGPDDLESICGCAVDRYIEANGDAPTGAAGHIRLPRMLAGTTIACAARIRPERVSDIARRNMESVRPPAPPTPNMETGEFDIANAGKPADTGEDAEPAETGSGGGWFDGISSWFSSLSLPAWLTGASLPFWIAIGIFVFGLLILKIRGRDPRQDLSAPPSHMRKGAPPQPARRPDLPR